MLLAQGAIDEVRLERGGRSQKRLRFWYLLLSNVKVKKMRGTTGKRTQEL
jgi:hypothetical protein